MPHALRPFATAGVAIVGASLIAITPVAAPLPDIGTFRDVALTSGEETLPDILAPWIDQFNTSSADATTLLNTFYDAPYIGLQQPIANLSGFLQDFFNDPTSSTVTSISSEMQANLAAVLAGYTLQDATSSTVNTVIAHTLDGTTGLSGSLHAYLFSELPSFLPSSVNPAEVTPIVDFLASPESGIIMGDLGPLISPLVELSNCITAGDDLNTTLADVTGAFFNGATLNLDSLIPAIEQAGVFPGGMNLENLDIAFGGLLTTGSVGPDGDAVGGSIFNSIGIDLTGVPSLGSIDLTGQAVGPLGAWEGWAQTIGSLLGWDGSGSPLADVTLPTIPDGFLDSGTAAASVGADLSTAAADLSGLWQDLLAAF